MKILQRFVIVLSIVVATLSADRASVWAGDNMELVFISSGTFKMGSPEGEIGRFPDEILHTVRILHGFVIMATEVTQFQWVEMMDKNPSFFQEKKFCPEDHVKINGIPLCPNHPVERVSWDDVQVFISKLNRVTYGYSYRLPTEAEWEYAARGGQQNAFHFGDNPLVLSEHGWSYDYSGRQTRPVASKMPNSFGLYDVHGNVHEWVSDWYGEYPASEVTDPTGPASGKFRVFRGGSWYSPSIWCRSATRYYYGANFRESHVGFRLVRQRIRD